MPNNALTARLISALPAQAPLWMAGIGLCWVIITLAVQISHMLAFTQPITTPAHSVTQNLTDPPHAYALHNLEPLFPSAAQKHFNETQIGLILTGVLTATHNNASAIIATKDNPNSAHLYFIGQTILPDVRLDAVYADRVVLNRHGVRESLSFHTTGQPWLIPQSAPLAPNRPTQYRLTNYRLTNYRLTKNGITKNTPSNTPSRNIQP